MIIVLEALLPSLALTLLFELPFAWLWGARKGDMLVVLIMNVLTNPLVVMWNYATWELGFIVCTVLPEMAAITAEAFLLRRFTKGTAYPILLGICINLFSYCAGVLLNFFG